MNVVGRLQVSLQQRGFNLFSVLRPDTPGQNGSLLLIGSAGNELWHKVSALTPNEADPLDRYTRSAVVSVLDAVLPGPRQFLYPSTDPDNVPNLQALGKAAGWHHDSPLGIGIHRTFGLWFAYRALVYCEQELPELVLERSENPCLSCQDTPCIRCCPASALQPGAPPNLLACASHRTAEGSSCEAACLSRLSCPVAADWRYGGDHMAYLYRHSLPALVAWVESQSGG